MGCWGERRGYRAENGMKGTSALRNWLQVSIKNCSGCKIVSELYHCSDDISLDLLRLSVSTCPIILVRFFV